MTRGRKTRKVMTLALGCGMATLVACSRPGEERAYAEAEIGSLTEPSGLAVEVAGGLARIARAAPGALTLWAQAPVLEVQLTVPPAAAGTWQLEVQNVPADSALSVDGQPAIAAFAQRHTTSQFAVTLAAGAHALRFAPPDADAPGAFRFVALADIQTALPQVHEVFAAINAVPGARFVVFMGDLTERSELEEYQLAEQQLQTLALPFYATLGNHELWADPDRFFSRFGRASFHFSYRDVAFTFADSGDAGLDPIVERWVEGWLDEARDQVHVFLSHFPPIDPAGTRDGSYRSHRDGHRLLAKLARGGVDLTLFGHIHTYLAYENAGIPSYVSGGGGARQERWDGISARHFLIVDISAQDGVQSVALRRVP
jgi:3',5'-cyclic-AMP phosphodiesterase